MMVILPEYTGREAIERVRHCQFGNIEMPFVEVSRRRFSLDPDGKGLAGRYRRDVQRHLLPLGAGFKQQGDNKYGAHDASGIMPR